MHSSSCCFKSFSFLPLRNSLNADGFKNQFFLKTEIKYLETYESVVLTHDVSRDDTKGFDHIKCKRIKQQMSHLCFTGISYNSYEGESEKEEVRKMIRIAKRFENIQKISFQGQSVSHLYYESYCKDLLIEKMFHLMETCRKLKHVEFLMIIMDLQKWKMIKNMRKNFLRN